MTIKLKSSYGWTDKKMLTQRIEVKCSLVLQHNYFTNIFSQQILGDKVTRKWVELTKIIVAFHLSARRALKPPSLFLE